MSYLATIVLNRIAVENLLHTFLVLLVDKQTLNHFKNIDRGPQRGMRLPNKS